MKKIVQISKKFAKPIDGGIYVENLEKAVSDLHSTPFKKGKITLYHKYEVPCSNIYNIGYGKNPAGKRHRIPQDVWMCNVSFDTLGKLKKHLQKAKQTENPHFKIEYQEIKTQKGFGGIHRVRGIKLIEGKYSTHIQMKFLDNGLIGVRFEYGPEEIDRVYDALSNLKQKGYERQQACFVLCNEGYCLGWFNVYSQIK